MNLEPEICYQALITHDVRFDGVFFVAVRTTKIYCRPVCRVKVPQFKNVSFHPSAASAEKAGFRPCLRCRPELAPGNASVDAVSRLAALAVNRIEDGALSAGTVDELAAEMGVSGRHLRRVVEAEYGVSPIELAQTQRLLMAKRLLTDSDLPLTEVALASGFNSVRRFNALFLERYRLNPGQVRKTRRVKSGGLDDTLVCELAYRTPYDWQSIMAFLKIRACPGIEHVVQDNGVDLRYMRTAAIGDHKGWLSVEPIAGKNALALTVSTSLAPVLMQVIARVKRLFDLQVNPTVVENHLGDLSRYAPGLRVPGAFDALEVAVRAVLGQQVSVKAASTLAGRLATLTGDKIETPYADLNLLTPRAEAIARVSLDDIGKLGIIRNRARSITTLAEMLAAGKLSLEPGCDFERSVLLLKSVPGIGDWTAEYIAMRCLAWPDAFPYDDLAIKKALALTNKKDILEVAEKWRPWRSYAALHLWKSLEKETAPAQSPEKQIKKTLEKAR